jgi:hypothetical protein
MVFRFIHSKWFPARLRHRGSAESLLWYHGG